MTRTNTLTTALKILVLGVFASLTACATRPQPAHQAISTSPAAKPQNSNFERVVRGRYDYLTIEERTLRGTESFLLVAYPDGTRTLNASSDIYSRNVHVNAIVRVDADFRPLEVFMQTWTQGQFKGSALFRAEGDKLREVLTGPAGTTDRLVDAPASYSIAAHPIATDSWQIWPAIGTKGEVVETAIYNVDGSANFDQPMVGKFEDHQIRYIGEKSITTAAGTFETRGYLFDDGLFEAWVTGEDNLVVRMVWPKYDSAYELAEYEVSDGV